jgi:MFS family permease
MSQPEANSPARKPGELRRVVVASLIGTTIEWYDFFLYGAAAALVFNKLFFPKSDPLTGTMLAFATYALGFVARPIGGVIFGHFGDRIGRKGLLMLSLIMMGVSSTLIGVLPTYAQVGVFAAAADRLAPDPGLRGGRRVGRRGAAGR